MSCIPENTASMLDATLYIVQEAQVHSAETRVHLVEGHCMHALTSDQLPPSEGVRHVTRPIAPMHAFGERAAPIHTFGEEVAPMHENKHYVP